jgi:3-oxoacyl-[acyl-carrier protein] reductase
MDSRTELRINMLTNEVLPPGEQNNGLINWPASASSKRLSGMTALVTGGSNGIGKGIALCLANSGCEVAIADIANPEISAVTVEEIKAFGGSAFAVQSDVSSSSDVKRMFDEVFARFSRLDLLVNNAGVQTWKSLIETTEEEWDWVLNTNLKGAFLSTQKAAVHMKAQGSGSIVNIGSGCNKIAFPNLSSYTASKGGLEMLTKVAAVELGPLGIRVNCVAPGAIEVERTRNEIPNYAETWAEITPLRRIGTPWDVASAVVFLASKDSAFINGQTISVDGGLFCQPIWPYKDAK